MDLINDKTIGYHRKCSPEMVSKLWLISEEMDYKESEKELNDSLMDKMFNTFNIQFNQIQFKQIVANAIQDKLLIKENDSNGFRLKPNCDRTLFGDLTHDWYCFECDSCTQELLIDCKTCFRAFHANCVEVSKHSEEFECIYCLKLKETDNSLRINTISSTHLNQLICLLINNLEFGFEKTDIYEKYSIEENKRSNVMVYKMIDLIAIKQKAMNGNYSKLEEFENDFKLFMHNFMVLVVNEWNTKLADILQFEKRFKHEVSELRLCIDCYQYSSDTDLNDEQKPYEWFTRVCEPPHELVFAKFGKYPFWPSKVIAVKDNGKVYDVRFFDPPMFSRALIPVEKLRPINDFEIEDPEELELALDLLEDHRQKLLEKGLEFPQTVTKSSVKKRTKDDQKGSAQKRQKLDFKPNKSNDSLII